MRTGTTARPGIAVHAGRARAREHACDIKTSGPGAAPTLIGPLGLDTALDLRNAVLVIRGPFRVRGHDI